MRWECRGDFGRAGVGVRARDTPGVLGGPGSDRGCRAGLFWRGMHWGGCLGHGMRRMCRGDTGRTGAGVRAKDAPGRASGRGMRRGSRRVTGGAGRGHSGAGSPGVGVYGIGCAERGRVPGVECTECRRVSGVLAVGVRAWASPGAGVWARDTPAVPGGDRAHRRGRSGGGCAGESVRARDAPSVGGTGVDAPGTGGYRACRMWAFARGLRRGWAFGHGVCRQCRESLVWAFGCGMGRGCPRGRYERLDAGCTGCWRSGLGCAGCAPGGRCGPSGAVCAGGALGDAGRAGVGVRVWGAPGVPRGGRCERSGAG